MTTQIDPEVEDVEERVHDYLKRKSEKNISRFEWTSIILIVIFKSL